MKFWRTSVDNSMSCVNLPNKAWFYKLANLRKCWICQKGGWRSFGVFQNFIHIWEQRCPLLTWRFSLPAKGLSGPAVWRNALTKVNLLFQLRKGLELEALSFSTLADQFIRFCPKHKSWSVSKSRDQHIICIFTAKKRGWGTNIPTDYKIVDPVIVDRKPFYKQLKVLGSSEPGLHTWGRRRSDGQGLTLHKILTVQTWGAICLVRCVLVFWHCLNNKKS